jgi:hypothetical protein
MQRPKSLFADCRRSRRLISISRALEGTTATSVRGNISPYVKDGADQTYAMLPMVYKDSHLASAGDILDVTYFSNEL